MKRKIAFWLALAFYCSTLPAWPAGPIVKDLIVKESPWVDVRAYGASTSESAANNATYVANAINAAADAGAGIVRFPQGQFTIDNISMRNTATRSFNGVTIEGVGVSLNGTGTELYLTGTSPQFDIGAKDGSSALLNKVTFRNLTITTDLTAGTVMRLLGVQNAVFENVYWKGTNGSEILLDGNAWVNVTFDHCYWRDAAYGVKIVTASGYTNYANVVQFRDCFFDDLDTSNDFTTAGRSLLYTGCTWEPTEAGAASANLFGSYNVKIKDSWFGDADTTGTWITATGEQITIEDTEIITGATGVDVQTTFPSYITGGRMQGATQAIRLAATRGAVVQGVRILVSTDSGIGINAASGGGYILTGNSIVESGTRTGTVAYELASGTSGFLTDKVGTTCDTFVNDGTTAAWEIDTRTSRLTGETTTDLAEITSDNVVTLTIAIPGALTGDTVEIGAPSAIEAGLLWSGYVSATSTVTIRVYNYTASPINPDSGTWRARVTPPNL